MENVRPKDEALALVAKQLHSVRDPVLLILKSHLLIEVFLSDFLEGALPNPRALDGARLTFRQKLSVAMALVDSSGELENYHYSWLWGFIAQLNSLRNHLAHNLEPKDLELRLQKFVKASEPHIVRWHWATMSDDTERVKEVLVVLCALVYGLRLR